MLRLEREVDLCDGEIREQRKRIAKAMLQTVNTDSLSSKIFNQLVKYIQKKALMITD